MSGYEAGDGVPPFTATGAQTWPVSAASMGKRVGAGVLDLLLLVPLAAGLGERAAGGGRLSVRLEG